MRWLDCQFVLLAALNFLAAYPPCSDEYPAWQTSPYIRPYPVGENYPLYQGNCKLGGHHGVYRYSYDFLMPIGEVVTVARGGSVYEVRTGSVDGGGSDHLVKIQHEDGTIATYSHLHNALVAVGQVIQAGEPIARSGNTGKTGGTPHLHS
ncbi:MAG: M23 family metallopeptidase [Anaerolineales bacterium]|nr:M23 family metallopeptidase [Anaerolineales bacterium]